jgi:hypothetical protein
MLPHQMQMISLDGLVSENYQYRAALSSHSPKLENAVIDLYKIYFRH